jgi:hypothetical protein
MRRLAALLAAVCLAPLAAGAQETPVVLELYTSQGCSSCPPADALFADLARRDDVIALALHVDYWDYLGWKDAFAKPRHSARQKAYAKAARSRTVFTPEMVVQGEDRLKGHDAAAIAEEIAAHLRQPPGALLSVAREGEAIRIEIAPPGAGTGEIARSTAGIVGTPTAAAGAAPEAAPAEGAASPAPAPADIHVVRYIPEARVAIDGGENAGQTVTYHNIVTDWQTIGQWDGRSDAAFVHSEPGAGPVAVIVQRARMGPVLAAARLP